MLEKRFLDITLSLMALIFMAPVIFVVAFLVYIKLGTPILFKQKRIGRGGRIFKMYKFRTMLDFRDSRGNLLSDEERLSTFGRVLRSTSLDELPELINVLKGDMSLVGPRPLLIDYLSLYSEEQMKRHDVLPGITGWAQINGRNEITWQQKFQYDLWYVKNRSFNLDIKIIFMTIRKVLKREGIYARGRETVERFNGFN
jgi:lipopolysaccharide/colanic/teichoic acid biosynthesis glycosyltransferase